MLSERDRLNAFSARLGKDVALVQGAGGNTSLKQGDELIVKASGKRLGDALDQDVFAHVSLKAAREIAETPPQQLRGLRPSIETSLHAVLPHRVVAHVHAVDVIAYAVRADARERLGEKLDGLEWAFTPYVRPGRPLALAVQALAAAKTNIFVLGNHGLLVGGEDFDECEALIESTRSRLAAPPRSATAQEQALNEVATRTGLVPASYPEAHWCALNAETMRVATAGTLYPDHVVFLGRGASPLAGDAPPAPDAASKLHLVADVGAFLPRDAAAAAHEMAGCLGLVAARVAPGAPIATLTAANEDELLIWDAEKHRQRLAGAS